MMVPRASPLANIPHGQFELPLLYISDISIYLHPEKFCKSWGDSHRHGSPLMVRIWSTAGIVIHGLAFRK
jgi:hypothetical protein